MSLVLKDTLTGTQAGAGFVSTGNIVYNDSNNTCMCMCMYREKKRDEKLRVRVKVTIIQIESQSQQTRDKRRN